MLTVCCMYDVRNVTAVCTGLINATVYCDYMDSRWISSSCCFLTSSWGRWRWLSYHYKTWWWIQSQQQWQQREMWVFYHILHLICKYVCRHIIADSFKVTRQPWTVFLFVCVCTSVSPRQPQRNQRDWLQGGGHHLQGHYSRDPLHLVPLHRADGETRGQLAETTGQGLLLAQNKQHPEVSCE